MHTPAEHLAAPCPASLSARGVDCRDCDTATCAYSDVTIVPLSLYYSTEYLVSCDALPNAAEMSYNALGTYLCLMVLDGEDTDQISQPSHDLFFQ